MHRMEAIVVKSDVVRGNCLWLVNSLNGGVSWKGVITSIDDYCAAWGLTGFRVGRLERRFRVLLYCCHFKIWILFGKSWEDVSLEVSEIFLSLEHWKPSPHKHARTVWVRCFRVPLHGWEEKTFMVLGKKLGEVIGVAKEMYITNLV